MKLGLTTEARSKAETLCPFKIFLAKALGRKIYIGNEQREGFIEPTPFYLFWCRHCDHWAKDYPHGYPERRHLYCSYCDVRHNFVPLWARCKKRLENSLVVFIVLFLYFGVLGLISWCNKRLKGEYINLD